MSEYKDLKQLKEEIYKNAYTNMEQANDLYQRLVPEGGDNKDYIILNSEFAVECLRVKNESINALIKLYSEVNKAESNKDEQKTNLSEVYKLLAKMDDPIIKREQKIYSNEDNDAEIFENFKNG